MAPDDKKKPNGGNTPKRAGDAAGQGPRSAKDRSRAQSRPVAGKAPGGKGGNTPKTGARGGAAPGGRARPKGLSGTAIAWGAVGLVLVVIVVLVIVKVTSGSSSNSTYTPVTPAPASVVNDVTTIPASVYDKVGVAIPAVATPAPPITIANQPPLTLGGKTPAMFYLGAEYCPYCAAERWAMVAALSRFGTFSGLKVTASAYNDQAGPNTRTFSFQGSTFTSKYISFFPVEQYTNVPTSNGYTPLDNPTKEETKVVTTYSDPKYIPGAVAGQVGYPFVDIGNKVLISGATYNPKLLTNLSHQDIAGGLNDPTNPVTQAIVGTANYITAGICASTNQQPSNVCQSSGVKAAAKALKLG